MTDNSVVRARIAEHIKAEAAAVLETMGLTVSDVFRVMLTGIARDNALSVRAMARHRCEAPSSPFSGRAGCFQVRRPREGCAS